ncbi:MAG: sulfotransferase [Actinomycetota bacterium]|nr:sulfotransferase [Actinomycetota bacterium]
MTLVADELEAAACEQTGLRDFGDGYHREGLERLVSAMNDEADLIGTGEMMQRGRLGTHLVARLHVAATYREHPEIDEQVVEGPMFVIGLPRTGTTALSQLVAADPQFRSIRLWEPGSPVPPPEAATHHTDPRIAATEAGLAMMNEAFPLMQTMYHSEATTASECQDLMGMSFRTVHMFALDALLDACPNARFLWSHRDPALVLGSVCSLVHYTRYIEAFDAAL